MCGCFDLVRQVHARWKHGFRFESTATGHLLSDNTLSFATRVVVAVGHGVVVRTDALHKNFAVGTDRDASQELASALVSTKSLPILGYPLGVRVSVVGKAAAVAGDAVQQAEVSTSPLRVHNHGIDVILDLLLDDDADALQQLRVSMVRPQLLEDGWEISRVEVAAGELLCQSCRCVFACRSEESVGNVHFRFQPAVCICRVCILCWCSRRRSTEMENKGIPASCVV